jgi:uncharacterized protein (TIGR03067 family)
MTIVSFNYLGCHKDDNPVNNNSQITELEGKWVGHEVTNDTWNFQDYADQHWSVVRYAYWMNINFGQSININPDVSLKPWQRLNWNDLNAAENAIAVSQNQPTGFTHVLAPYGDQQYYKLIAKYPQFGSGWDDAATFKAGGYTKADVIANNGNGNVSPEFVYYRNLYNKASSFYAQFSTNTMNIMDSTTGEMYNGTFIVNTSVNPKQLDFNISQCSDSQFVNKTTYDIYKIIGDTLTFASNEPGNTIRPLSFTVGNNVRIFTFIKK